MKGHTSIVRYFIKTMRMDVSEVDAEQRSVLALAVLSDRVETVRYLVENTLAFASVLSDQGKASQLRGLARSDDIKGILECDVF